MSRIQMREAARWATFEELRGWGYLLGPDM
jgi:hypothetical protein